MMPDAMRRLLRILLNTATVMSLVLALGTLGLVLASYVSPDWAYVHARGAERFWLVRNLRSELSILSLAPWPRSAPYQHTGFIEYSRGPDLGSFSGDGDFTERFLGIAYDYGRMRTPVMMTGPEVRSYRATVGEFPIPASEGLLSYD